MYEKVNPSHPDKIADRIAGAIVDIAYARSEGGLLKANPRLAVEVLLGHGKAHVIIETSLGRGELSINDVVETVTRICPDIHPANVGVSIAPQDDHLADNQRDGLRAADNGIFRGMPMTDEQRLLTAVAASIYANFPTDGKYIVSEMAGSKGAKHLTVCQSNATQEQLLDLLLQFDTRNFYGRGKPSVIADYTINPLGEWSGGQNVDCGATNRKLGSDMGDAVTGGGLHGKDLSKADVSVNIVCHILAQQHRQPVEACCSIGDKEVTFHFPGSGTAFPDSLPTHPDITLPFPDIVELARLYITTDCMGSFERMAEWGLIRPSIH